jgi:hypothetical protein
MNTSSRFLPAAVAGIILASAAASAATLVFRDEHQFAAATGSLHYYESFETTEPGWTGSSRVLDLLILGPLSPSYTLTITEEAAFASHGNQAVGGEIAGMYIVFQQPVNAFGFNIIGFGDLDAGIFGPNLLRMEVSNWGWSLPMAMNLFSSAEPYDHVRFFGILTDQPFRSISISQSVSQDFFTIDELRFGTAPMPVPEPASYSGGLFALGLLLMTLAQGRSVAGSPGSHAHRGNSGNQS